MKDHIERWKLGVINLFFFMNILKGFEGYLIDSINSIFFNIN